MPDEYTDNPPKIMEFPVLDHGFLNLVDVYGDDLTIVDAARLSYQKGTKQVSKAQGLIDYLVSHYHTSPLEMCEIKVHVKLPIFVARQWIRHRTASVNEMSGRYSEMPRTFYIPDVKQICYQDTVNRQGSSGPLPMEGAKEIQIAMKRICDDAFNLYDELVNPNGEYRLSRETARIVLPLNTYTEWVWKLDLNNMLKFLMLRADPHAQWEIRVYAEAIEQIIQAKFPMVYAAYCEYMRDAVTISASEFKVVKSILDNLDKEDFFPKDPEALMAEEGMTSREVNEMRHRWNLP